LYILPRRTEINSSYNYNNNNKRELLQLKRIAQERFPSTGGWLSSRNTCMGYQTILMCDCVIIVVSSEVRYEKQYIIYTIGSHNNTEIVQKLRGYHYYYNNKVSR
jgi:hypothetical protein